MGYHSYQRCYSCSGRAQPGTVALMKYMLIKFPYARSLGIYSCRDVRGGSTLSIHACGRALDIGIPTLSNGRADTRLGHPIILFLDQFTTEFGIMGQIYNRVRYDSKDPRGRYYGGTHPHYNHDHVEMVSSKALKLTYNDIVLIAGPPTPQEGEEQVLREGMKDNRAVADIQQVLALGWNYDMGTWPPFSDSNGNPVRSWLTGKVYGLGQDGDYGPHLKSRIVQFQKAYNLEQTGEVDGLTADYILSKVPHILGAGSSNGVSEGYVRDAITAHANQKASSNVHPHGHDEGKTGGPI